MTEVAERKDLQLVCLKRCKVHDTLCQSSHTEHEQNSILKEIFARTPLSWCRTPKMFHYHKVRSILNWFLRYEEYCGKYV